MIFNYDANKTHFHKKGFAISLVLKASVFELGNGLLLFHWTNFEKYNYDLLHDLEAGEIELIYYQIRALYRLRLSN